MNTSIGLYRYYVRTIVIRKYYVVPYGTTSKYPVPGYYYLNTKITVRYEYFYGTIPIVPQQTALRSREAEKEAMKTPAVSPSGIMGAIVNKSKKMVADQVDDLKHVGQTLKQGAQTVRDGAARLSTEHSMEDFLRKGKERLSFGVAEAADVLHSHIPPSSSAAHLAARAVDAASAVGSSFKEAVDESGQIDSMIRSKNKRILELEEERVQLHAQLRLVMSDSALADAVALAKQKEQEVELIKQRTVAKFKELVAEKSAAEGEKHALSLKVVELEKELARIRQGEGEDPGDSSSARRPCTQASPATPATPSTPAT